MATHGQSGIHEIRGNLQTDYYLSLWLVMTNVMTEIL